MLSEMCITLYLSYGLAIPSGTLDVTKAGTHLDAGPINSGSVGVGLTNKHCYQSQMQIDAEKEYRHMNPQQQQAVLNHILRGE